MERRGVRATAAGVCLGTTAAVLLWTAAAGALQADEKCEAFKNRDTGKLALCLQRAEMKLVKTEGACSVTAAECYRDGDCPVGQTCDKDLGRYIARVAWCNDRFLTAWGRDERKGEGQCPDEPLDPADLRVFVADQVEVVAGWLSGAGQAACGDGSANRSAEQCDGADLRGRTCETLGCSGGTLGCLGTCAYDFSGCAGPCAGFPATGQKRSYGAGSDGDVRAGRALSYTDNGDGTITDNNTGLMWEKKDDDGGIHDWNNNYTWGMTSPPYTMDGTMVTGLLAALNTVPCFTGRCDWRIPNVKELQTIVDYEIPSPGPVVNPAFNTNCAPGCTVDGVGGPMCSCAASDTYWSSTTSRSSPGIAWGVGFGHGGVSYNSKNFNRRVRAVRGGL